MTRAPVDGYFEWLLRIIRFEDTAIYWKTLDLLFHRPFHSDIPCDDNREADGLALRGRFMEETGEYLVGQGLISSCSVLEMMVALAIRIEFGSMHDPDYGDRTAFWFWGMFENLGLDRFDDYRFDVESVNNIVDIFLERRYDRNGRGSLFTINDRKIDMRREELWYQAQRFLAENYF